MPSATRLRRPGLRLRITAGIAAIALVAVAALSGTVHVLVLQNRINAQRTAATQQVEAAIEIYRATGLLSFGATIDDPHVPAPLRAAVSADGARATDVSGGATRQLWAAGRTGDKVLSIGLTFRPLDEGVRAVDQALLVAGLGTVLLASLVGAGLATSLSRRLRLAAVAARAVRRGEQRSLRGAVGPGQDEVGDLADAVDAMADRLAEQLRSEQRFTADVAHDLRTPVTGLATAAALLDDSRPAEMVRDRVAALTVLVEELLEVARLDTGVETAELEHIRIADVAQRVVARGVATGECPANAVLVWSDGDPETTLSDPRRLDRVLSNLIRNALKHGGTPVEISCSRTQLTIRDHGTGFDERFLALGPQRFAQTVRERGGGHGLGLIIALGQTTVLGGTLVFDNAPDGGARVHINLPGAEVRPQVEKADW